MIKISICCKDMTSANALVSFLDAKILEDHFTVTVYDALTSPDEIIDTNIFFIDTDNEINGLSGIEFANKVSQANPICRIIFIDSSKFTNEKVYEVDHIYLLHKPLQKDSIEKALSKALRQLNDMLATTLKFYSNNMMHFIPLNRIVYLEKNLRKIIVHTTDKNDYSFYGRFNEIEPILTEQFIRCHNGIIVNLDFVITMHPKFIQVIYNDEITDIPVSRSRSSEVKHVINWYRNHMTANQYNIES